MKGTTPSLDRRRKGFLGIARPVPPQINTISKHFCLDLPRNLYEEYAFEDDDTGFVDSDHAATILAGQLLGANELREASVETIKRMEAQGLDKTT